MIWTFTKHITYRQQRVKLGDVRSEWSTVTKGVPQGSILGPLLFNVFINNIFFLDCDCHIYTNADDTCISYSSDTIDDIRKFLTKDIIVFMNRFKQNSLKANPVKFQTMLISSHGCDVDGLMINVQNTTISCTEIMKVLGVKIDNKLNFAEHISDVCIKAGRQLNILERHKRAQKSYGYLQIFYNIFIIFYNILITVVLSGCSLAGNRSTELRIFKNAPCVLC